MRIRLALLTAIAALVALLAAPAAHALSPPAVYLQEVDETNQPIGSWFALASTPTMHSVNRYEIGVALQDTGLPGNDQRILVQVSTVPSGPLHQPDVVSFCPDVIGTAGQIVDLQQDIRYQGDGSYSISATATPAMNGDFGTGCAAGPTTTGSFTAAADTAVRFVGHMVIANPVLTAPAGGLQVVASAGAGGSDIRCARDPKPAADGSLTGSLVINQGGDGAEASPFTLHATPLFPQPGIWACVARSIGGGIIPGPWSAATAAAVVQAGLYAKPGSWRLTKTRGPVYGLSGRFTPALAAGGRLTVLLQRVHGRTTRITTTRIGPGGHIAIHFRLPKVDQFAAALGFRLIFSFAGTRFAAARPAFPQFGLIVTPNGRGGASVEFGSPCGLTRC